ncbi:ATPase [Streptomyces sp. CB02959]|nr:ATPase [Streptomyces sp. CB02959]
MPSETLVSPYARTGRASRPRRLAECHTHVGRCLRRPDGRGVRPHRPGRQGGRSPVNVENIVGLIVAGALVIYLILCLIFPEKF